MAMMKAQTMERPAARKLSGLMLLAQVQHLRSVSSVNLVLALICVLYFGCNVVLIILNSFDLETEDPEQEVVVSKHIFHMLEFWSTFVFNVVGVVSFFYSPDGPDAILRRPLASKAIFFINIAGSVVSAVLITINLETFELPSHELEYSIGLTMAAVDMLMIGSLWRRRRLTGTLAGRAGYVLSLGAVALAIATATVQLVVYNCGEERIAHYFEFTFEMFSSSVTFWFIMENKLIADAESEELLHMECCGPPQCECNPEAGAAALEDA